MSNGLYADNRKDSKNIKNVEIGMQKIKVRRQTNTLRSLQDLKVADCVPFYFCPRSPMLYIYAMNNHLEIQYKEGQEPIIHLEADFNKTADWADLNGIRWVFTDSNAGNNYFDDYNSKADLTKLNWEAIRSIQWRDFREEKMAEFLLEDFFPFSLVEQIGVYDSKTLSLVRNALDNSEFNPNISIKNDWYYQ